METAPPLSFPAILRNPGLVDKYAHLKTHHDQQRPSIPSVKREYKGGKRWIRRRDNGQFYLLHPPQLIPWFAAQFSHNPHVVAATKADYAIQPTRVKPTFPEPLPRYLPRTCNVPSTVRPPREPTSANAGRFSLSLKGMRRGLRKCGFRAESLVLDIEHDMLQWLQVGGVILNPDDRNQSGLDHDAPGTPIGKTETVFEVSRTPLQLVWFTDDDNFARYVVHCCARYHGIVSFSMSIICELVVPLLRPRTKARTCQVVATPICFAPTSLAQTIMLRVQLTLLPRQT